MARGGAAGRQSRRLGREMNGIPILGALDRLPEQAERLGVHHAIVAMPNATHQQRRRAVDLCTEAGVAALTVPDSTIWWPAR